MSIFSLLPDILPMILPAEVHVTKAIDLAAQRAGNHEPMIRQGAMVGKCDKMCASLLIARPQCASAVHHHGEQDTIVYAVKGTATLVTNTGNEDELQEHVLTPGDFAFIPPWTEHQEVNETDEEVVWILMRSGAEPVVVYMKDWGGARVRADS